MNLTGVPRVACGRLIHLLVLSLAAFSVAAWSKGAPGCDYRNFKIGNETYDLTDIIDGKLNKECAGCIMPWTKSVVKSSYYVWRTGGGRDISKDPPKTYIPDSVMPLYLFTTDLDKLWAGIHLSAYQTEAPFENVGGWEFPPDQPFHEECNGRALTHGDGLPKLIKTVFYFKTPPKGTGEIKFHALLKQGYQGTGYFYWPAVDLVLTESQQSPLAVLAGPGQSCSDICKAKIMGKCNATGFSSAVDVMLRS
jgi:hypothetical protein